MDLSIFYSICCDDGDELDLGGSSAVVDNESIDAAVLQSNSSRLVSESLQLSLTCCSCLKFTVLLLL